jgi:hypothetical protein
MAQISRLKDLEGRKRALVAESEVYRQTLKLEIQNIRLYGARMQRKFALARLANPLFLLAGSYIGARFFGRGVKLRRRGRWSWLGMGLLAWRALKNYGPLLQNILAQRVFRRGERASSQPEQTPPQAEI